MSADELLNSRHKVTGNISRIPASYLSIYPDTYEVLDAKELRQHYIEVEEDKVIYALDKPEPKPKSARSAAKKEGK